MCRRCRSRPEDDQAGSGGADRGAEVAKYAETLRERERRTLLRKAERGEVDFVGDSAAGSDGSGAEEEPPAFEEQDPSLAGAAESAAEEAAEGAAADASP